jgi:hypothetical protein
VVVIVTVVDPAPITDAGLKVAVAPAGNPFTPNVTVPEKPPVVVTVAVYEVEPP